MVTLVREVQAAAAAVSSVPAPAVSPAPPARAATSPVRPAGLAVSPVPGVGSQMEKSQGVVDPAVLAVEENPKTGDAGGRGNFCERDAEAATADPLVLTGVLAKFAEGTAKLGGNQVAFRLATLTGPHSWIQ